MKRIVTTTNTACVRVFSPLLQGRQPTKGRLRKREFLQKESSHSGPETLIRRGEIAAKLFVFVLSKENY